MFTHAPLEAHYHYSGISSSAVLWGYDSRLGRGQWNKEDSQTTNLG